MKPNFKPILFSTPMVQSILAGRKTQTRRIIKSNHESGLFQVCFDNIGNITSIDSLDWDEATLNTSNDILPKYLPDDILWVRETWQHFDVKEEWSESLENYEFFVGYTYKASNDLRPIGVSVEEHHGNWVKTIDEKFWIIEDTIETESDEGRDVWYPSIHMPKAAARIFLKVTDVRCERLNDISEEDAIAEGILKIADYGTTGFLHYGRPDEALSDIDAVFSYETLWEKINGKNSWSLNPWVWVYTFEKIEQPENWSS